MLETRKVSLFFSLPLELREEIYKSVLSSPSEGSNMLRTCHEIRNEAHKFLYQKPLVFRGQEALYTWLEQTPRELVAHVSEITVHVQDVDLRPILCSAVLSSQFSTPSNLPTSELYHTEVGRLEQALKEMPKVKTITLRALSNQPSFLYRHFVSRILEVLGTSCPALVDLRLEGNFHHQELQFLMALTNLESFSFDGFSSSSPATMIRVLGSLNRLRNLSLVSERVLLTPNAGLHSGYTEKCQSFTGDVVRTMRQLASFSVTEHVSTSSPTLFFTSEVLNSLSEHKTLRSLSIRLSHPPDMATLSSLEKFLERTAIEHLELDWPDLEPDILEQYRLLSGSLRTLWVRVESEADAFDILWSILESRHAGDLLSLRKVVLLRSTKSYRAVPEEIAEKKAGDIKLATMGAHKVSLFQCCTS
jgi:hypothetical protein